MVEIHHYDLILDVKHTAWNYLAFSVEHRDSVSYSEDLLMKLAVYDESCLRDLHNPCLFIFTVAVSRGEAECELVSWLLALKCFLEFREEHVSAVDVVKRLLLCHLVHDLTFNFYCVADLYDFVLSNFHILCTEIYVFKSERWDYLRHAAACVAACSIEICP